MFRSAIVKVTSFCNLNCSYCYMFNLGDKTYQNMPKYLSIECMEEFITKVFSYMRSKALKRFNIILHGGEPFLWPLKNYKRLFELVKLLNSNEHQISITIQTNAYKINWDLMQLLYENNISIGISIDGPKDFHDKFRVNHAGKPSYDNIIKNVEQIFLKGYSKIIGGFLTVVDPSINPEMYFKWVLTLPVKRVDVLWPIQFNYQNTPWSYFKLDELNYKEKPPYGKWFFDLFKIWMEYNDPEVNIRFFNEVLNIILGGFKHGDMLVNDELNMFVLNTDGAIEYHDYFRALTDGNNHSEFNINCNNLIDVEQDSLFQKFFNLKEYMPSSCNSCINKSICGGGFYQDD